MVIWSTGNEIPERGGLNGGYVLEAGEYKVSIRRSAHEVIDSKSFNLGGACFTVKYPKA